MAEKEIVNRYKFDKIFSYSVKDHIITPRYPVIINDMRFGSGYPITQYTSFGGLTLFHYFGKDVAGRWDDEAQAFIIKGFY